MKRFISLLVIIVLLSSIVPVQSFAEEDSAEILEPEIETGGAAESGTSETTDSEETEASDIDSVSQEASEGSAEQSEDSEEVSEDAIDQTEDTEMNKEEDSNESAQEEKINNEQTSDTEEPVENIDKNEETVSSKSDATAESDDIEAEEEQTEEAQYNDLGIKKGTEVYGEDISKLTEEELQYVPEGWRDGEIESEHPEEEQQFYISSSYPNVNDYILSHNLSTAKLTSEIKSYFPQFNYRGGYGKVEGVVAHETANDNSTIRSEINYMSINYNNAFVHAFVDHNNIIQIHNTNRAAWGAGRFANQRFVHVELVREHTFENFAKSINNYADYIASILYQYNLGVTSAESNGRGTLWSHSAVSKYLGGTTHVDPHGYFAKWGYNWNDFVKLVTIKYNEKAVTYQSTSKIGHIRSANALLYKDVANLYDNQKAGTGNTNRVYYIKKQAVVNGTTYYLLSTKPSSSSGTIGWMKAADTDVYDHKTLDSSDKVFTVDGDGKAYSKTWGGSKDLVYNLSSKKGKTFKVNLTEAVGKNIWFRGTIDGRQVWIHSSYVTAQVDEKSTSLLGHLKSSAKIYKSVKNPSTFQYVSSNDLNQVYYIKKQAVSNGETYYLISYSPSSTKNTVGWVNKKDMSVHTHTSITKQAKTYYLRGTGSSYNKAWGGSKNLVYSSLSKYAGQEFKVNLTEKVGNNYWYRGTLNGKTMWIHTSYLTTKKEETISRLGHLHGDAVIYKTLGNPSTEVLAKNGYTNAVYYIKKQAVINKTTYYLISNQPSSTKGTIGWVDARDMNTYAHTTFDHKAKNLIIRGTGKAYTKAWGGSKDLVFDLSKYKNQEFKVNLTEKVGGNFWYRGILDGKEVWIHTSYLKSN